MWIHDFTFAVSLSPDQQVDQQHDPDAVEDRRDVEEHVVVDDHEDDHQRDADAPPRCICLLNVLRAGSLKYVAL